MVEVLKAPHSSAIAPTETNICFVVLHTARATATCALVEGVMTCDFYWACL